MADEELPRLDIVGNESSARALIRSGCHHIRAAFDGSKAGSKSLLSPSAKPQAEYSAPRCRHIEAAEDIGANEIIEIDELG